jgi:soluble cytochrome b562
MGTLGSVTAGMATLTLLAAAASGFPREMADSEESIQRFQKAVDAYVELREKVTEALPPLEISPDTENFQIAVDAIAAALREARPSAAEGDIINAEVAVVFRKRIRTTLIARACTVDDILAAERNDERAPLPPRPIVHDQFDWGAGSFMPACVLSVLPLLPDLLQFRFVQRDLVLVDISADLVVDVLPDALPPSESWEGVLYAGSSLCERDFRIFNA